MSSTLVTERKNKPLVSHIGAEFVIQQDPRSHQSTEMGILLERDVRGHKDLSLFNCPCSCCLQALVKPSS